MTIEIANRQTLASIPRKTLRALCSHVLDEHNVQADLSLCYVDNPTIRDLNARFRRRDEVTDVLAFPLDDDDHGPDQSRLLGEIVVSVEEAIAEVRGRGTCGGRPAAGTPAVRKHSSPKTAAGAGERAGPHLRRHNLPTAGVLAGDGCGQSEIDAEIALYTVHGLLHLLGYDDQTPGESEAMRQAEQKALAHAPACGRRGKAEGGRGKERRL
jgi:probable rRNA maturation factor